MTERFEPITDPRPDDDAWPQASWPIADDVVLRGRTIELRRTRVADAEGLAMALADEAVWKFAIMEPHSASMWQQRIEQLHATSANFCQWTVVLNEAVNNLSAGTIVGTTAYLETSVGDARTEIGFTSYDPRVWATRVNPECKFLLLEFAFENLNMGRVQLKTDARNARSQQAIARLGAQFEGVLRRYQRRHDGTVRDTVMFSITAQEWPMVRAGLIDRLGGDPRA